jgi:hypothetical protein
MKKEDVEELINRWRAEAAELKVAAEETIWSQETRDEWLAAAHQLLCCARELRAAMREGGG